MQTEEQFPLFALFSILAQTQEDMHRGLPLRSGAKVIYHKYEDTGHTFPGLYFEQLSQWVQFINIHHK